MARIIVPVADLSLQPEAQLPQTFDHHALRDSQLLYNEKVEIVHAEDEWLRVRALEQGGLEGWVRRSEVGEGEIAPRYVVTRGLQYAYGTYLEGPFPGARPLPSRPSREQLVAEAPLFLGAPYLWGGRSSYLEGRIASVDCSGLINLLYRAQGVELPRNAAEQQAFGRPVDALEPGDALYLAKEERVNHVILALTSTLFIEAPESGKCVRYLHWGVDIWEESGRIHYRDRPHSYHPYPTTFLRHEFFGNRTETTA